MQRSPGKVAGVGTTPTAILTKNKTVAVRARVLQRADATGDVVVVALLEVVTETEEGKRKVP